ncbi:MAG: hypothetical protein QOI48_4177 [Solirubrobacteraceae bacterium]|nr:hypothetical protein [Solirubrobacteraceae bacterium]
MEGWRVRDLEDVDVPPCVEVMRSNVPTFFLEAEVAGFERWLRNRSCPYLVTENARHRSLEEVLRRAEFVRC